jgi:Multicopper oxidase
VTADALGRWAFHCHLLYHMTAGMFREVRVEEGAAPPGEHDHSHVHGEASAPAAEHEHAGHEHSVGAPVPEGETHEHGVAEPTPSAPSHDHSQHAHE